ncbi:MAG: DUF3043 domain-containing protein [Arachnia sp.]
MGLFRPYERKAPDATPSTQEGKATPPVGRVSSLTPKGEKRAAKRESATLPVAPVTPSEESVRTTRVVTRTPQKKQGATPTRRQAEADRMQRLHPSLNKREQKRADRDSRYKARVDSWDKIEGSPERMLLRDYVDVRWTITEFLLPVMLLLMASVVATAAWPSISFYIGTGLWLMLGLSIINTAIMWKGFKKLLAERLPNVAKRGLLMYMFNRALMIRRFRRPSPRVVRGASI